MQTEQAAMQYIFFLYSRNRNELILAGRMLFFEGSKFRFTHVTDLLSELSYVKSKRINFILIYMICSVAV
jgi:hypothetical protein